MHASLLLVYLALVVTLMQAVLVKAHRLPRSCARCRHPLERQELGGQFCRCARS